MGIVLNGQQNEASKLMVKWWKSSEQLFQLDGLAGTGKTTIVKYCIDILGLKSDEVIFTCFTGKATQVLTRKGNFAKTIHSLFYELVEVPRLDENGSPIMVNGRTKMKKIFQKRDFIDPKIKLIVVDEGGMVGKRMALDILSFGIKTIVLGDLHQLPPVKDEVFFLKNPDYSLTQIMRQAENNPIIWASQQIINGENLDFGQYGNVFVISPEDLKDNWLTKSDIILTGTNKTRDFINNYIRQEILKIYDPHPVIGDKLICRQNNWQEFVDDIYLINGLIGYVEYIDREMSNNIALNIRFRPDFVDINDRLKWFNDISLDLQYFKLPFEEKRKAPRSFYNKFELGHAITTHLSQGSEYDKVIYFKEQIGGRQFTQQIDYTAITRAKDMIIIVKPKQKKFFFNTNFGGEN